MIARHPPLDPQTLAHSILSEKRFRVAIPTTHRSLWEMFWSWLRDLWSRLADAFFSHVHIGSRAGVTIGVVVEAILIAAVVFMLIRLLAGVVRDARKPRSAARPLAEPPD